MGASDNEDISKAFTLPDTIEAGIRPNGRDCEQAKQNRTVAEELYSISHLCIVAQSGGCARPALAVMN